MQFVAEIGDGQILCEAPQPQSQECELSGVVKVQGDWHSFQTWTLDFSSGELVGLCQLLPSDG